jgi:hypothetical protein
MGRANIKDDGVKFTSENQPPAERKSRKGIPNRATVFKKFLNIKKAMPHPEDAAKELKVTLYEAAALGQLLAAQQGNTQAWKEIQDSLHGPVPSKSDVEVDVTFRVVYADEVKPEDGGDR